MNQRIIELIKLSTENPGMDIITMTNWEICCDDTHTYWMGNISRVEIDWLLQADENLIIGMDEIEEHLEEEISELEGWEDERLEKEVALEIERLKTISELKQKIIIYIDL